jgi:hypothetical protein
MASSANVSPSPANAVPADTSAEATQGHRRDVQGKSLEVDGAKKGQFHPHVMDFMEILQKNIHLFNKSLQ